MNQYKRGLLCGILGPFFWGISGTFSQYMMQRYNLSPLWVTGYRMFCAGLVMFILLLVRKKAAAFDIFRNRKDLRQLMIFAIGGLLINQISYLSAIRYSDAGTATILQSMSTIVILVVTSIMARRLPRPLQIAAVFVALIGIFLITTGGSLSSLSMTPKGLFYGISVAFTAAFYPLLSRSLVNRWDSLTVTGYGMLIGGIVLVLCLRSWQIRPAVDPTFFLLFGFVILVGTVSAYSLFLQCVHDLGPLNGNLLAAIEPLTAAVLSVTLLHASFGTYTLIGFSCVLFAVLTVQISSARGGAQT